MIQGGKGRRTRRRGEVKVERAVRASSMREWLQDRVAAAQKRNAAGRRRRPSGTGVTELMKQISRDAAAREPEYVVLHTAPNRAMRRQEIRRGGESLPGVNTPYVAPSEGRKVAQRLMGRVRPGRRSS